MNKLLKRLTWKKRWNRVRDLIYNRLIKRGYKIPMYNSYNGDKLFCFFKLELEKFEYSKYNGTRIKGYVKPVLIISRIPDEYYAYLYIENIIDIHGNYGVKNFNSSNYTEWVQLPKNQGVI